MLTLALRSWRACPRPCPGASPPRTVRTAETLPVSGVISCVRRCVLLLYVDWHQACLHTEQEFAFSSSNGHIQYGTRETAGTLSKDGKVNVLG